MNRLAVITDSGTATGFRMAGVDTFEVASEPQLQAKLAELIATGDYGLIAGQPLPFPVPKGGTVESGEAYLNKLVKDAIGFYVKLK